MRTLIRVAIVLAILAGCACASLPSQHQQIAAACESAASAAEAIAAAQNAGRVSHAQGAEALRLYRSTVVYCEPPAESLNAIEFQGLRDAAAELVTRAGSKP
jgi:hypothetical protein